MGELEPQQELSVSFARDFYLETNDNDADSECLTAPRDVDEGDVVLYEDSLPHTFQHSESPNCMLAEVEVDGEEQIVLIALADLKAGEALTIAADAPDEGGDSGVKSNTADGLDPRLIARESHNPGDVVLEESEMPDQLSFSEKPNCEIREDDDCVAMVAVRAISAGEVLSIAVEGNEEYEEWELDPASGLMSKIS